MNWIDISNPPYSPETAQVLEQRSGNLRVLLHRHGAAPKAWFVTCAQVGLSARPLSLECTPQRSQRARGRLRRKRGAFDTNWSIGVAPMTPTRKSVVRERKLRNKIKRLKRTAAGRARIRRTAISASLDFRSPWLRARPTRVRIAGRYTVEICLDDDAVAQARMVVRQIPGATLTFGGGGVRLPPHVEDFTSSISV